MVAGDGCCSHTLDANGVGGYIYIYTYIHIHISVYNCTYVCI